MKYPQELKLNSMIDKSKASYIENQLHLFGKHPKKFWRILWVFLILNREGAKNSGGKKAGLLPATGKHRYTPGGSAPGYGWVHTQD